jgi:pilus assembly protein Flp/PilA
MLNYYVQTTEALKRLRADKDGVVSFEYVLVAACVIAAVGASYSSVGASTITMALTNGLTAVLTAFNAFVAG